jgi:hypothetical protein
MGTPGIKFHGGVQDEHLDYMNLDSDTDSVPHLQNDKDTSKYYPFEFRSGSSPPRPHPPQISHVTHEIQADSKTSNVSQSEDTPMENYDQMANHNTIPTLINQENGGDVGVQSRPACESDDEHYLRLDYEPHLWDEYPQPILDVLAEIKETIPVDHRQERKKREQHGYKSTNWEQILHRAYLAVQALLDARLEKLRGNDYNTQGVECIEGDNELSDTLTVNSEAKTNSTKATEETEDLHDLTTDSDEGSGSERPIQVQRKLFLIIDKFGTASLKTNDPAMFSRLSRMIDLKRSAGTELNPSNKRRCTDYQLGMSGVVAHQGICLLLSDDPSHGKMEYPYTYLALNKNLARANDRISAIAATSSALARSHNQGVRTTSGRPLRNTAGDLLSKASTHSAESPSLADKAGPNGKQEYGAENPSETSPADSKGKHSAPTSDARDSASIKKAMTTAAESRRNYSAPIKGSGVTATAGKHHKRSGISFWECILDFVDFIMVLLLYGFIVYLFFKFNLHLVLLSPKWE